MHVSRICWNPKLRICLVSFKLPCLNLGCYIYIVATLVAYIRLWMAWKSNNHLFSSCPWNIVMVIIKIIELIGIWRTTQESSTTTVLYGSGLS
jgi:hypothetical protein